MTAARNDASAVGPRRRPARAHAAAEQRGFDRVKCKAVPASIAIIAVRWRRTGTQPIACPLSLPAYRKARHRCPSARRPRTPLTRAQPRVIVCSRAAPRHRRYHEIPACPSSAWALRLCLHQMAAHILGGDTRDPHIRLYRHAGDMRGENKVRALREKGAACGRQRLLGENVKRRAGEMPPVQRRNKRILVDDAAASGIDKDGTFSAGNRLAARDCALRREQHAWRHVRRGQQIHEVRVRGLFPLPGRGSFAQADRRPPFAEDGSLWGFPPHSRQADKPEMLPRFRARLFVARQLARGRSGRVITPAPSRSPMNIRDRNFVRSTPDQRDAAACRPDIDIVETTPTAIPPAGRGSNRVRALCAIAHVSARAEATRCHLPVLPPRWM